MRFFSKKPPAPAPVEKHWDRAPFTDAVSFAGVLHQIANNPHFANITASCLYYKNQGEALYDLVHDLDLAQSEVDALAVFEKLAYLSKFLKAYVQSVPIHHRHISIENVLEIERMDSTKGES